MSLVFCFSHFKLFPSTWTMFILLSLSYSTRTTSTQACLSLRRLPKFAVCITLSRLCDHCKFHRLSKKKIDAWDFFPLDWGTVCISRQSNKISAHFSLSKFSHHFLLSLLSSLASEDDISTLSSRLSLGFPLSPLPGSSIFHPPWCLSAQRTASRLSSPKQAAFVSWPLESHRSHLGSVIFFLRPRISIWYLFFTCLGFSTIHI